MATDWVVFEYPKYRFHCRRCGNAQPIKLPIDVTLLADWGVAFEKAHAKCKAPKVKP